MDGKIPKWTTSGLDGDAIAPAFGGTANLASSEFTGIGSFFKKL